MTAPVIPIERRRGSGRQPAIVEELRDQRDELTAITREDIEFARRLVDLCRAANHRLARGVSPADLVDAIETAALRLSIQRTATAIDLALTDEPVVHESCVAERALNHGRAA